MYFLCNCYASTYIAVIILYIRVIVTVYVCRVLYVCVFAPEPCFPFSACAISCLPWLHTSLPVCSLPFPPHTHWLTDLSQDPAAWKRYRYISGRIIWSVYTCISLNCSRTVAGVSKWKQAGRLTLLRCGVCVSVINLYVIGSIKMHIMCQHIAQRNS